MKRVLGTLFVTAVALVLAVYSAMRSLDFINLTLPPDQAAMGYLALVATEGGIFCWLIYYLHGADGAWQRGISLVMTIIDLVGSIALFTADTLLQAGRNGLAVGLAPDEIRMVIMGLSALIALNIAATVACHLFDPENMKRAAEQEAFSAVQDATLDQITKNANTLASELAPVLSADWMRDTRARYTAALGTGVIPSAANVIDGKAKDAMPPKPIQEGETDQTTCGFCGADAQGSKGVNWWGKAKPGEASSIRLCNSCAKDEIDSLHSEAQPQAQPAPQVDPALLAAIMAAMAATQPAQPAPNGNGHNKPAPAIYAAETVGTPPLEPAP